MKRILTLIIITSTIAFMSCKNETKDANPFFSENTNEFKVPEFDKIKDHHYLPAFIEAMKQQNEEIKAIVENTEAPTFENTILPYDQSGRMLTRVARVFFNLQNANTNDEMQKISKEVSPLLSKHGDEIAMNPKLFERIKAIYNSRNESNLDAQQIRVVEKYYNDFVRGGANLPKDKQDELKAINESLSLLSIQFGENILAETNKNFKLVIDKKEDLAGLPENVIAAAAETAKSHKEDGKWVFTLAKPSWIPFLQYSEVRPLREKLYKGWFMRGDNGNEFDNKEIVKKISEQRAKKAELLGFDSYAAYVLDVNMAKTTGNVDKFLLDIWTASLPVSKAELAEMQQVADKEGNGVKIESWDWWYYAEKIRKSKYDFDENEIKPYLSVSNVRDGVFTLCEKLYGITFAKNDKLPKYHKDVEVYEVKESNGDHVGIVYLDYFPRDSKSGGAWCTHFVSHHWEGDKEIAPVISIVCNFTPPVGNEPALLTFEETTTFFHEFGHALHGLFTKGKYKRTAGSVTRDYVELPSQIMENWAGTPELLKLYAKHYKTGEIIPDSTIAKLQNSRLFNQGFETVENIAACILDMDYHKVKSNQTVNTAEFEKNTLNRIGLIPEILPRYRSTYFSHIFDGGYAAGYYVYMWAAVLDADAFEYFAKSGDVFNKEIAAKFRQHCLAECGDDDGMVQYAKFRGQAPTEDAFLKRKGLK